MPNQAFLIPAGGLFFTFKNGANRIAVQKQDRTMPRLNTSVPNHNKHKGGVQTVDTLKGKDF